MRFWLALFALLGLLLTPVAAAAAAPVCLEHAPAMASAPDVEAAHDCCPQAQAPQPAKPAKPDHKACETACALMAAGIAALPAATPVLVKPAGRSRLAAAAPVELLAHPPATPERPPRHLA